MVEPFGAGLHVRGDPERMKPDDVRGALVAAGGQEVMVEKIEPTLEDVFLAVAGRKAA